MRKAAKSGSSILTQQRNGVVKFRVRAYVDSRGSRGYAVDTKVNDIRPVGSVYIQDLGIYSR